MKPQGQGHRLGHEITQRDLDSITGKTLVDLFTGGHEPVDAGVDGQMDLGSGLLGLELRWAIVLRIRVWGIRCGAVTGAGRRGVGEAGFAAGAGAPPDLGALGAAVCAARAESDRCPFPHSRPGCRSRYTRTSSFITRTGWSGEGT